MKKLELAGLVVAGTLIAACGGSSGSDDDSSSSSSSSSSVSSSSSSSSSSSAGSADFIFEGDPEAVLSCEAANTVQGYAAIDEQEMPYEVTGGADVGNGNYEVVVTDGVALRNAVYGSASAEYQDKPLTVYVEGLITWANSGNSDIRIERSDVSIIGRGENAGFEGVGIEIKPRSGTPAENIIIRNLEMRYVPQSHGAGDIISLNGNDAVVRNVWIDHNELYNDLTPDIPADCTSDCNDKDYHDELVSGRGAVRNVTISYNDLHDSWKTSLWGSSDSASEDAGRTITFHHNHWHNVSSRLPLFRYGEGHVFNNYYQNVDSSGVNARMGAEMRIDGNIFENVHNPIVSLYSDELGYWNVEHNIFTDVTTSSGSCNASSPPCYGAHETSTSDFMPPYEYALMDPNHVKAHIEVNVGPGKIDQCL